MSKEKEILKYFNSYYYFAKLTQNAHQIPHTLKVLENKSKISEDIDNFYRNKNEDKHITKQFINITTNEIGEKILRIKPSKQLKDFAKKIASNNPYLSEYNFKKLIKEHKEEIQNLKTDTEKIKYFIQKGLIKFNQKFILALNSLNLTIFTKDSKIRTFIYPLEYIKLDEYNSAILTGIVLSKSTKKQYSTLLEEEYIEIKLENLPIVKNEFIFNKFLPKFPKEKSKESEDEYPTLSYLINKSVNKIELIDIEKFFSKRTLMLKNYLIKPKEEFIERIDIPQGVLNYEKGFILFEEIQESQINFDLIIEDKLLISDSLKAYLETDYNNKVHYRVPFLDNFTPYYGTNTKDYPLAKGQSEVLENYVKQQSLIPVIGAPGTGKTTLFKSVIANNITTRALSVIYYNKDYNNMMLMTSTARKAVDNVIKDIEEENPFMGALVLLSKDDAQQENRRAKALSQFFRPIKEIYKESIFNSEKFIDFIKNYYKDNIEKTEDIFLEAYEKYQKYQIKKLIKEFNERYSFLEQIDNDTEITAEFIKNKIKKTKEYIDNLVFLYNNKEKLDINIHKLKQELKELKNELKPFVDEITFLIDRFEGEILEDSINDFNIFEEYQDFFFSDELTFLLNEFESSYNKIKTSGIISGIFYKLLKKEENLFKDFKKRFKLKNLSNNEFLDTLEEIKKIRKRYNTFLKKSYQVRELNKMISMVENLQEMQENLHIDIKELSKYDSIKDFYRLAPEIYKANYILYKLSESFLILDAYEKIDKEELISKLSELKKLLELNNFKAKTKKEIEQNLIISSRFFPVIGATNKKINIIYSSKRKIKENESAEHAKFYHTIMIDEAGMLPSADAIHSINIGKQALIVGDPKQLEPIPEIPEILLEEFESYIKKQNPKNEKYHKIFSASHFSAYDIASGVSILKFQNENSEDFIGKAFLLDEHRRCQRDIAELFIKVADYPKDLKIETFEDIPEYLLKDERGNPKYLEFYDCQLTEKPSKKNTNPLEIEAIEFLLKDLEKRGIDLLSQVGIITPFLNQASELIVKFGKLLGHSNNKQKIGTVHKFQGAEFDIIIFSSVLSSYNKAIDFVANNINLLNVSISRAKKLYIHVGDINILRNSGKKPMIKYLSHFDEKGMLFDYKEVALKKVINELNIEKANNLFTEFPENKRLKILENLSKLKDIEFEDEYFYNSQSIAEKMCELISNAKQSILFIVPWIRESALDYIQKNADLSNIKNGKVKINFRVLYHKSEKYKLKKIYPKLVEVFGLPKENNIDKYIEEISIEHGTHEKIMIVDREKLFMGSFNFLSSGFYDLDLEFKKKHTLRDEIAILKGCYDVWSYLLKRYKTLGVKQETLYYEMEKFINKL